MTDQPSTLAAALVQLQGRLPHVTKDATVEAGTRRYSYANLASIHESVFPLMAECGLAWTCRPTINADGRFVLRYRLEHAPSGEQLDGDYPLTESNPQTMGGQITYARRYALCAVLGIAPAEDDDDAQAATNAWTPAANPRSRKASRHRADRNGPLPDDQWTARPADEDEPGSMLTMKGLQPRLMAAFNKAGITAREDRLAVAMSVLDLPELTTSNDLSIRQASRLIAHLEGMAG